MITAIPVPRSVFNPHTRQWEAPVDLTPPKTHIMRAALRTPVIFGGEKDTTIRPDKNKGNRRPPKCWKHQSNRDRQYYR